MIVKNTRRGQTQNIVVKRLSLIRGGFTLIEILVAVLIIGILAAVAVPQYQRAVLRSRYAALMPIAKSMADSNEAYYLEHGEYADNAEDLPVQGRQNYPNGTELEFGTSSDYSYVLAGNTNGTPNNVYVAYQKHSKNFPDNIHCEAADDDELATWLCRDALHGTPVNTGEIKSLSGEGYTAYVLSGSTTGSTFDRSCEGEPETVTQPCPGGCGFMSATPTCNPYTGEWEEQDLDPSTCPVKPANQTANCSSGSGKKTRTAKCKTDKSGYEWGAWDESACCTGTPSTSGAIFKDDGTLKCTKTSNVGSNPTCVNGQWQYGNFSANVVCENKKTPNKSIYCTSTLEGASNGGACSGTYTGASCKGNTKFGCANSTFTDFAAQSSGHTSYMRGACTAEAEYGCANSTFQTTTQSLYAGSICSANKAFGCDHSTFIGSGSRINAPVQCVTSIANGCSNATFKDMARCTASAADACKGSTFKSGGYCHANAPGGCDNVTYDGGCCYSTKGYCPSGTPKCNIQYDTLTIDGTW